MPSNIKKERRRMKAAYKALGVEVLYKGAPTAFTPERIDAVLAEKQKTHGLTAAKIEALRYILTHQDPNLKPERPQHD